MRNPNIRLGQDSQFRVMACDTVRCPKCRAGNLIELNGKLVRTVDAFYGRSEADQKARPSRTRIVTPLRKHQC
jgi:hypothetical protein